jgi:EmrB/QacA subfamily drug resistance transporter
MAPRHAPVTLIALAVSSGLFMDLTDTTALATALPTLAREFRVDPVELKLALTAYLIAAAMLIPISGWLADRYGARRVFLAALVQFMVGSILCALSQNLEQLVLARVFQGIGGGLMTPVGRLIVVGTAPRSELLNALNWFTIPAIFGPLLGPPLAGFLIEVASWRWVFLLNIPIGVIGFVMVWTLVPPLRHHDPDPFDTKGAALVMLGIGTFMVTAELIGLSGVPLPVWLALLVATMVINGIMLRHMLHAEQPILDLRLFRIPTFRASMIGGGAIRIGVGAMPFLLPLLLQDAIGLSPFESGMVMLISALGSLTARLIGPATLRRMGFRSMLIAYALGGAVGSSFPVLFRPWTPMMVIAGVILIANLLRVSHFAISSVLTFVSVPPEHSSRASTLSAIMQQVTISLGVSFGAVALSLSRQQEGGALTTQDFMIPFLAIGAIGLLALPGYIRLPRAAGEDMLFREGAATKAAR